MFCFSTKLRMPIFLRITGSEVKRTFGARWLQDSWWPAVINRAAEFDTALRVETHAGPSESGRINVENSERGLTNVERSVNRKRKARSSFTIRLARGVYACKIVRLAAGLLMHREMEKSHFRYTVVHWIYYDVLTVYWIYIEYCIQYCIFNISSIYCNILNILQYIDNVLSIVYSVCCSILVVKHTTVY